MTLRKKTLAMIGLVIVSLAAVTYFSASTILNRGFQALEREMAQENVERIVKVFSDDLETQNVKSADWAVWDDTYRFIRDRNPKYIRSNINDTAFADLGLNFMAFLDTGGDIVYAHSFDLEAGKDTPLPAGMKDYLRPGSPILRHGSPSSIISGFLALPDGPLFISSRPIVTSQRKGPIRGTILFGRFLRTKDLERLSEVLHYRLDSRRLDDPRLPPDLRASLGQLNDANPYYVSQISQDLMEGYTILKDINGKPALVLRAEFPRKIYQEGKIGIRYLLFTLTVVGFSFLVIALLLLEGTLLSRLARLGAAVQDIGRRKNFFTRIPVEGPVASKDELGTLSRDINGMLDALEQSQLKLSEREEQYRDLFENANDLIQIMGTDGRFLFVNRAWRDALGYSEEETQKLSLFDILHPDCRGKCREVFDRVLAGEQVGRVEADFVTKAGKKLTLEGNVNCRMVLGKPFAVRGIFRDVTERKRLEKTKEDLIAMMSHEVRTYVTSIRGALGVMRGSLAGDVPPQAKKFFEVAVTNCEELFHVIQGALKDNENESDGKGGEGI